MKKVIIAILVIIILVFAADKVYKIYSRNNVNSHEAIVLINNRVSESEVDAFFNLEEGTFDSKEHVIVFSLMKKDAHLLDKYINLPARLRNGYLNNAQFFDCHMEYSEVRHYGFYNYEIASTTIIARIITKNTSPIKGLNSEKAIGEKGLNANFEFGKINILDVNKDGVFQNCDRNIK